MKITQHKLTKNVSPAPVGSGDLFGSVSARWFVNVWASCGHRLTVRDGPNKDGDSWSVRYADYDREGGRSAIYASVCNKCYGRMRASGALLTHEQVEEWLTNGNLPALPNAKLTDAGTKTL